MSYSLTTPDVFSTLDKIVGSPVLGEGSRLPALLRYLVVEELEGRGERIKAFSIATDVFGRGATFDPQTDSIVRVETARLRKALQLFSATDGAGAPLQIEIPKGGYRPIFVQRTALSAMTAEINEDADSATVRHMPPHAEPASGSLRLWKVEILGMLALAILAIGSALLVHRQRPISTSVPVVVVNPVAFASDISGYDFIRDGLQADIAARLASFHWLAVVQADRPVAVSQETTGALRPDYIIDAVVQISSGVMRVRSTLAAGDRKLIEWSQDYTIVLDHSLSSYLELTQEMANRIAIDIGRPTGAISKSELARRHPTGRTTDNRYICMLLFRDYWRNFAPASQHRTQKCLEEIIAKDRQFADGLAALSFIDLDILRSGRSGEKAGDLLRSAQDRADAALAIQPEDELPLLAVMAVAACVGDKDTSRRKGKLLVELFPFWPVVLSTVGTKMAMIAGDWDAGLALVDRAAKYNTAPEPWYPLAPAMRMILDRKPADALARLTRISQRSFEQGHMVRLAAAQLAGNKIEAAVARQDLDKLGVTSREQVLSLLSAECWSDEVKTALRPALENAF